VQKIIRAAVVVAMFSSIAISAAASPPTVETGWGPLTLNAGVAPKSLPARKMAAVSAGFGGRFSPNKTPAPQLREMVVDIDRNASVDAAGLVACPRYRIKTLDAKGLRGACRRSMVGIGTALVSVAGTPKQIPLGLVYGGSKSGVVTILIHGVIPTSSSIPVVVPVKVRQINAGRFGLRATATIPKLPLESSLLTFRFTVERRFMHEGAGQSFAKARCRGGHLSLRLTSLTLSTGEELGGSRLVRSCTVS
jgi:hypothetical protein